MRYATAADFRAALEQRLKTRAAQSGVTIPRLRKQVVFDRLLARLILVGHGRWTLKGGYALDLRLGGRARTTVDLDVVVVDARDVIDRDLANAAPLDLGDYFSFVITPTGALSALEDATAVRFHVQSMLAGRRFENVKLDVGFGEAHEVVSESLQGQDLLAFADIEPITVPTLSLTQHVAEKVHAYSRTYEGGRQSTRVKDLLDLVLVAELSTLGSAALVTAIEHTFEKRGKQLSPKRLDPPPDGWRDTFRALATEVAIDPDLEAGWQAASVFLNPVLGGEVAPDAVWSPDDQRWVVR